MIISHKFRYIFIQIPRTGSSAIGKELCENYDGSSILSKHSNFFEFARIASLEEKSYFVFAGVRNPLDDIVSIYMKLLTNHRGSFSSESQRLSRGGFVTRKRMRMYEYANLETVAFTAFVKKYFCKPYTSNININKESCSYIVRFERLVEDFSEVLRLIGVHQVRPLPMLNQTKRERDFESYFDTKTLAIIKRYLLPFMEEWDYAYPTCASSVHVTATSYHMYEYMKWFRRMYARTVMAGPLQKARLIREFVE